MARARAPDGCKGKKSISLSLGGCDDDDGDGGDDDDDDESSAEVGIRGKISPRKLTPSVFPWKKHS